MSHGEGPEACRASQARTEAQVRTGLLPSFLGQLPSIYRCEAYCPVSIIIPVSILVPRSQSYMQVRIFCPAILTTIVSAATSVVKYKTSEVPVKPTGPADYSPPNPSARSRSQSMITVA